ncbi:MAG TPA: LysR substrate-binding domain-containing protein [Afifellaceae bacterium]|nr:LysR substrate-binding domain-containing protein [Afifellaceae bacterium]
MSPLDPDQLRTFIAIAETGSFTRAATMVARTQSAVSMQMRRLEERVGRPLFERDGRSSRLTGEGERLLPHARRILKAQAEALQAFDNGGEAGLVRLGVPDDYAGFLPEVLGRFACCRPLVEITVECQPSVQLIDLVQANTLDIAIITHLPSRERPIPYILRREPLVWLASDRHNVHEQSPLPLAAFGAECRWRQIALEQLTTAGRDYRVAFSSWNSAAVLAAIEAGLGVSVLPIFLVRPGMRVLSVAGGFPPLPDCEIAVIRAPDANSRLVDALHQHIVEGLAQPVQEAAAA